MLKCFYCRLMSLTPRKGLITATAELWIKFQFKFKILPEFDWSTLIMRCIKFGRFCLCKSRTRQKSRRFANSIRKSPFIKKKLSSSAWFINMQINSNRQWHVFEMKKIFESIFPLDKHRRFFSHSRLFSVAHKFATFYLHRRTTNSQ